MDLLRKIPQGKKAVLSAVESAEAKLFDKPISEEALEGLKDMGFKEKTFGEKEAPIDMKDPQARLETAMGVSKIQHGLRKGMEGPDGPSLLEKAKKTDPFSKEGGDFASTLLKGWDKPLEKALSLIGKWADGIKAPGEALGIPAINPVASIMGGCIKKMMEGARETTNSGKLAKTKGKGTPTKPGQTPEAGQAVGKKDVNEAADTAKQALGVLMQAGQLALLAIPGVGLLSSAIGRGMAAGIKGVATQAMIQNPGLAGKSAAGFLDLKKISGLATKAVNKGKESFEEGKKQGDDIHQDSLRSIG
jgi:hypothetical protein